MTTMYYTLDADGEPLPTDDVMVWARFFEDGDQRRVALTEIPAAGCTVSTVFLGLDHGWDDGPPVLWETLVFTDDGPPGATVDAFPMLRYRSRAVDAFPMLRYRSRAEAVAGHESTVAVIVALLDAKRQQPRRTKKAIGKYLHGAAVRPGDRRRLQRIGFALNDYV